MPVHWSCVNVSYGYVHCSNRYNYVHNRSSRHNCLTILGLYYLQVFYIYVCKFALRVSNFLQMNNFVVIFIAHRIIGIHYTQR